MQDQIDKLLYDYNNKITAQNTSETQKLLVFSVGRHNIFAESQFVGGLADRLKGLVTAFYLAVMTSRRFVIYWKSPVALENNLAPHKYDWSFENARKFIYGHHDLKHFDMIDRSEVIDKTNARDLEADLFHDDPVIIMNMNSYRIKFVQRWFEENHAMQASYNQLFTKAFQFLFNFIPKAEFQERKERFETAKAGADKMVGVHLRTGSGNG